MAKKIKWTAPLAPILGNPGAPAYTGTILGAKPNPEWLAKHEARLDKVAKEAAVRREGLRKTYEYFVEYVPDALGSSSLDQKEKEYLNKSQAKLRDALRMLGSLFEGGSSPVRRNEICYLMTEAIWSANALGRFSPPVRAIRRMEKILQSESARASKKPQDAEKAEGLRKVILAVTKGEKLKASWKYANSIQTSVRDHLGIMSGTWPAIRTIQRAIGAILNERRES